jgi:hypothetical protein
MLDFLKTTKGVGIVALILLVVVVAWMYDSYHKKNMYGLFTA